MSTKKPKTHPEGTPWFTEPEAADYCRCSLWAFRRMHLPAFNAGGRKVYNKTHLDDALTARPWAPTPEEAPFTDPRLAAIWQRLTPERKRAYKARKHDGIDRTPRDAASFVTPPRKTRPPK